MGGTDEFLGRGGFTPPQCRTGNSPTFDPVNVFGAASSGLPTIESRRCSRRERVNSDPRQTRTEGKNLQNSAVRLLTGRPLTVRITHKWKVSNDRAGYWNPQ